MKKEKWMSFYKMRRTPSKNSTVIVRERRSHPPHTLSHGKLLNDKIGCQNHKPSSVKNWLGG